MEGSWISIIPPITAIILAVKTRQIILSLFAGIFLGWILYFGGIYFSSFSTSSWETDSPFSYAQTVDQQTVKIQLNKEKIEQIFANVNIEAIFSQDEIYILQKISGSDDSPVEMQVNDFQITDNSINIVLTTTGNTMLSPNTDYRLNINPVSQSLPQEITADIYVPGMGIIHKALNLDLDTNVFSSMVIFIFDAFTSTLQGCVDVFKEDWKTRNILFTALVGVLIALMQRSGGIMGLIDYLTRKNRIKTRRSAEAFTLAIGGAVMLENNMSSLTAGAIARPIFDRLKIAREKLAYILDSTAAPICILIPINAWGVYIASLLDNEFARPDAFFQGETGIGTFVSAYPYNFYAIFSILFNIFLIITLKDFGPMKKFIAAAKEPDYYTKKDVEITAVPEDVVDLPVKEGIRPKAINMLIPVFVMIIGVIVLLVATGLASIGPGEDRSDIMLILERSSGSTAVLWGICFAILVAAVMYIVQKILKLNEIMGLFLKGVSGFISISIILLLSFAIGDVCNILHTGEYLGSLAAKSLPVFSIPVVLFILTCFISFSTGTSWGSWAIMIPIGVAVVSAFALSNDLAAGKADILLAASVGAMLGGGIFGDHASPISDTTVVSSAASCCDVISHVKSQLPYSLIVAGISSVLLTIVGIFIQFS